MKKIILGGLTFSLALVAASNVFHVTFDSDAWIGASEVKPGSYKVQIEGDKAVLTSGKRVIEAPAKLESGDHKFQANGVVTITVDDKRTVQEIQIGGTNERIVFSRAGLSGD